MDQLAYGLAVVAVAGAAVSWVIGAWYYVQTLRALSAQPHERGLILRAIVAWPFVLGRLKGAAAEHSARVNKSLVAFFACLTVAVAAISVATNLARMSR
jgi:hypothetical protein